MSITRPAIFVATAVGLGLVLALVPHTTHPLPLPYQPEQARLDMVWAFNRVHVHPVDGAATYGVVKNGGHFGAGHTVQARAFVRPTGGAGGRVCLSIVAKATTSAADDVVARTCRPLVLGWHKFDPVHVTPRAPSRVYARIEVTGNPGGIEVRPVTVSVT